MIMLFYLLMWGGMGKLNLLYTIIFGWILFQNPSFTFKCLFFLFITQFVCILYESLSGHFLYTEITSGTFNQNEYDYSGVMDYFSDTGFRPKGLFPGTLIGASFIIYYSLLMRNNLLMMFWDIYYGLSFKWQDGDDCVFCDLFIVSDKSNKYLTL